MPTTVPDLAPPVPRGERRRGFREVLLNWLMTVPPGGWRGTIEQLELRLRRAQASARLTAVIPCGSGLGQVLRQERQTLADLGFTLRARRTASSRTIEVRPKAESEATTN